jgi:hypothetical protein
MTDDAAHTELPKVAPRKWVRVVRVGMSVFFGMLTVVLVVMWVRSYWWMDTLFITQIPATRISSNNGYLVLNRERGNQLPVPKEWIISEAMNRHFGEWYYFNVPTSVLVSVPHWFVAGIVAAVSITSALTTTLPIRSRFSLSSLFIATTLVALVLGAVVWAAAG